MTFDGALQFALGALVGGGVIYLYLRHVAGWLTSFEAGLKADVARVQGSQHVMTAILPQVPNAQAAALNIPQVQAGPATP
jgi:hypothetical protein